MDVPTRLRRSLGRLATAVDQLDAAAARRQQADASRGNLEDELAVMQDDRARLALDLDAALARGRALSSATGEVARRLGRVEDTVRTLVSGFQPTESDEPA